MAKNKTDKPNQKNRLGTFLSKSGSELKKVTWPTFATVMQNMGIVLAVVVVFTAFTTAVDVGLSALLDLLVG